METRTLTLSEFLLARIAEDVDVLTRPESFQHATHGNDAMGTFSPTCPTCRQFVWGTRDRALVECEAKRRIVAMLMENVSVSEMRELDAGGTPSVGGIGEAVQMLTLPYADHPDYREEWRV